MRLHTILPLALLLPLTQAAETTLALYIFSRHGDRTSKSWPPTTLTPLGYNEIFTSGSWFRQRYINGTSTSASSPIANISRDVVKLSQIAASAPLDSVLMPSAQGFLQGLYPPVGADLGTQTLGNGTKVAAPLDGYQLIPIQTVAMGTGSEDQAWLQGSSNCANAIASSNGYYMSDEYMRLLDGTRGFYSPLSTRRLMPARRLLRMRIPVRETPFALPFFTSNPPRILIHQLTSIHQNQSSTTST